jgi:hypothetical protein
MEPRRRPFPLEALVRLLREVGGAQTVDWALGAGVAVGFAAMAAGGLQGSFGSLSRRVGVSLGAHESSAARIADAGLDIERRRLEEQAEHYRRSLEEAERAKEAREEEGAFDLFGSIFGGPLIGTQIGEAIGDESGDESDDVAAILAPVERFGSDEEDDD